MQLNTSVVSTIGHYSKIVLKCLSLNQICLKKLIQTKYLWMERSIFVLHATDIIYMKKQIPPQSQINKMSVPDTPEVLNLTPFETRLLARRYPFMKIVQLPKGKQRGIIGRVVNVPVDANDVCTSLPRTLASSGILPVKMKRKKSFKGHATYHSIRLEKVKIAFK